MSEMEKIFALNERIREQIYLLRVELSREVPSPWMTKDQAAQYLAMSVSTLEKYMDRIAHSKATGRPKFHRRDLDAFMESQKYEVHG